MLLRSVLASEDENGQQGKKKPEVTMTTTTTATTTTGALDFAADLALPVPPFDSENLGAEYGKTSELYDAKLQGVWGIQMLCS